MKKKKKVKTLGQLKKQLWKHFSLYRKLVNSMEGVCHCISCGNYLVIGTTNCQGGHYLPKGGYSALYFVENNVWPQCYRCNVNLGGNTEAYRRNLILNIGEDAVEDLWNHRHDIFKVNKFWYLEKIEHYKGKVDEF